MNSSIYTDYKNMKKAELKTMLQTNKHKFVTKKFKQPFYDYAQAHQIQQK